MSQSQTNSDSGANPSGAICQRELRDQLIQFEQTSRDLNAQKLREYCCRLIDLSTLVEQFEQSAIEVEFSDDILTYCSDELAFVKNSLNNENDPVSEVEEKLNFIEQTWGEYIELLPEADRHSATTEGAWEETSQQNWNEEAPQGTEVEDEPFAVGDMGEILAQLEGLQSTLAADIVDVPEVPSAPKQKEQSKKKSTDFSELIKESIDDPELISAYVDDAQQCLAGMESCLLELENDKNTVQSLGQFCRELHTLKGASGTVGLMKLSEYLHDLETDVEEMSRGGKKIEIDPLLAGVDFVRQQVEKFAPQGSDAAPVPTAPRASAQLVESPTREIAGETYVRLEASRLDRLMDLLAELVMLRNRRETYVSSLQNLFHEINSCSSRLRQIDTYPEEYDFESDSSYVEGEDKKFQYLPTARKLTTKITELSKDVAELGHSLYETVDPLSRDNSTISHLIGNFRSELMELRRQPITGLFRRLHRVARDAGKTENRQVELTLLGQGTRIERSLQERLYEPLMHMIRNSVCHGIESAEDRVQAGKPPVGQITLEAWSDETSMYLEIRDDGRGLNEAALEKKGLELGLIRPGIKLSQEKLWELILQPGFSTRAEVSQNAGRGVGMDVVASQIRSLRGKVKIDSVLGKQTSFRLEIPLNSTIEHAMIVRCGEQLFALPMHMIFGTQTNDQISESQKIIGLHELLEIPSEHSSTQRVITLRQQESHSPQGEKAQEKLSIVVDAVVGVEEVVVRSLPRLLQNHHCFSGVTLSGEAETVLVLDVPRLSEFAGQFLAEHDEVLVPQPPESTRQAGNESRQSLRGLNLQSQKILVVDDSISVRKNMIRKLEAHGFEIIEAADGIQGLEKVRSSQLIAVISDIDMPRMNGIDFVSELRRSEKYQTLPVVVVTSRRDENAIQAMRDLGVRQVFTKPINDTMMKSLLHSIRFRQNSFEPTTN